MAEQVVSSVTFPEGDGMVTIRTFVDFEAFNPELSVRTETEIWKEGAE